MRNFLNWLFSSPTPIAWDPSDGDQLSASWMRHRLPIHEERTKAEMESTIRPRGGNGKMNGSINLAEGRIV